MGTLTKRLRKLLVPKGSSQRTSAKKWQSPPMEPYERPPDVAGPQDISTVKEGSFTVRGDIAKLLPSGGIGVELGVALGQFSERMLKESDLSFLYSIDMWSGDRGHDVEEYKAALQRLLPYKERNSCLRMKFEEALSLFPDEYFDFIYIDGYAHTGQNSGRTLSDWWPKLKHGGVFSGDDYSPRWPPVMREVDEFMSRHDLAFYTLTPSVREDGYSANASWITFKP